MRIRLLFISTLILSLSFALYLILPSNLSYLSWFASGNTSVYTSLVESCRDSLMNTAEYSLDVIFPYDFIEPDDEVSWRTLQRSYDFNRSDYLLRESSENYLDRRLPAEWKYAALYRLCRESGLDPAADPFSFVVIGAGIKAGVPLPGAGQQEIGPEDLVRKKLHLSLPAPRITDIIIKDRPVEGPGYPEVRMEPDQWSFLIEKISPGIVSMAEQKGILDEAGSSASALLSDLFEGAGFEVDEIRFTM